MQHEKLGATEKQQCRTGADKQIRQANQESKRVIV
jgi:hypothetical protein